MEFLYEVQKNNRQQQNQKKKKKDRPGVNCKTIVFKYAFFIGKLTESSSFLGGKVLDSFALFSSKMSHKKGKGPSSLKQQSLNRNNQIKEVFLGKLRRWLFCLNVGETNLLIL